MLPERFGRYEVIRLLGVGGMADVYLARDTRLGRPVAVKAPRVDQLNRTVMARFEQEAQAVAELRHYAIIPLFDYGDEDGRPYFVMPYMTGGSLADRLEKGAYTLEQALPIIERIASALDYAHVHRVIHRDVKPGNILFDDEERTYLSDFGIARVFQTSDETTQARLTHPGFALGTATYVSPEQVQGIGEIGTASDIYSLGVVIFEMLSGRVPYGDPSSVLRAAQHVKDPIPSVRALRRGLPEGVEGVLNRALAKRPQDRYPSCAALVADLERVVAGEELPDAPYESSLSNIEAPLVLVALARLRTLWARSGERGAELLASGSGRLRGRLAGDGTRLTVWQLLPLLFGSGGGNGRLDGYETIRRRGGAAFGMWAAVAFYTVGIWQALYLREVEPILLRVTLTEAFNRGRLLEVASLRFLAGFAGIAAVAFLLFVLLATLLLLRTAHQAEAERYWSEEKKRELHRRLSVSPTSIDVLCRRLKLSGPEERGIRRDWNAASDPGYPADALQARIHAVDNLIASCERRGTLWRLAESAGMHDRHDRRDEEVMRGSTTAMALVAGLSLIGVVLAIALTVPAMMKLHGIPNLEPSFLAIAKIASLWLLGALGIVMALVD